MKIREGPMWILMTLFHSLSVSLLFQGPYAGWLIFLFNYFQREKKSLCGAGPSFPWRRQEEASCFLPAQVLEASLTFSSAEKWAVPSPRERCLHLFKASDFLSKQRVLNSVNKTVVQGYTCFSYRAEPACSQCVLNAYLGDSKVSVPLAVLVSFSNKPQVQRDAGILMPGGWGWARAGPCEKRAFGKPPLATFWENQGLRRNKSFWS